MLGRKIKKEIHGDTIGKAVTKALKCLYSDRNWSKFQKEAMLGVFCGCFKDYYPNFPEERFRALVRGK